MNNSLTIIITASFIPSHPNITIIEKTITSLKLLTLPHDHKIILAHDFSDNNKYTEYLQNINTFIKDYDNILCVVRDSHGHLTGNIRNALQYVNSKYILLVQHDLPFIKNINFNKIMQDMDENTNLKYIRFNKRKNTCIAWDSYAPNLWGEQVKQSNYIYTRTGAWSDNNHICLTSYYKDIIMDICKDGIPMELNPSIKYGKYAKNKKGFIQNCSDVNRHNIFGTYIFGPIKFPPTINHLDGRHFLHI